MNNDFTERISFDYFIEFTGNVGQRVTRVY